MRFCSCNGCSIPALVTLTYVYADSTAVLGPLSPQAEPHCYDLCKTHATKINAPRGWQILCLDPAIIAPEAPDVPAGYIEPSDELTEIADAAAGKANGKQTGNSELYRGYREYNPKTVDNALLQDTPYSFQDPYVTTSDSQENDELALPDFMRNQQSKRPVERSIPGESYMRGHLQVFKGGIAETQTTDL